MQTQDHLARLVIPSPAVDRLLSLERIEEEKVELFWREPHTKQQGVERVQGLQKNPDRYNPGRRNFLSSMAQQPAESIPPSSYLRLLENSKVKCSNPLYTTTFIKVRVTSGPLVGRVGWVCEDDVFRTVTMP
ncbi:MAG TPA: hypothetical protein VMT15_08340 [Bryobacteraceae bacterium]|nr:hypothetical protein [Bryobacteraceae bacterium]